MAQLSFDIKVTSKNLPPTFSKWRRIKVEAIKQEFLEVLIKPKTAPGLF